MALLHDNGPLRSIISFLSRFFERDRPSTLLKHYPKINLVVLQKSVDIGLPKELLSEIIDQLSVWLHVLDNQDLKSFIKGLG